MTRKKKKKNLNWRRTNLRRRRSCPPQPQ